MLFAQCGHKCSPEKTQIRQVRRDICNVSLIQNPNPTLILRAKEQGTVGSVCIPPEWTTTSVHSPSGNFLWSCKEKEEQFEL